VDRALWFVGPRQVQLRAAELDPVGDDDVRVRTIFSGVSAGTELLAFRGELPADLAIDESFGSGTFTYPFRYGYSAVGEIEEVGRAVRGLARGDVVFAFHPHAECFVASTQELLPVGGLEPRLAVLLPYVETALQIALDAGSVFGEPVLVSGLGVLGVLVSCLIQRAGGDVIAIEPQPWRREAAAELGIAAVAPHDAAAAAPPDGVPLAIECSGNPAALTSMLGLLGHEGTVLVASWYGTKPVTLPLGGDFHRRRLTIRSTQVSTIPAAAAGRWDRRRRIEHARDLANSLPLAALASHTIPFGRAADGYQLLDAGSEGVIHVAFGYR
jgi:2-desacetyl-2-hydroxyethyl bacteriochlorophyllide A dehydrogenase